MKAMTTRTTVPSQPPSIAVNASGTIFVGNSLANQVNTYLEGDDGNSPPAVSITDGITHPYGVALH